MDVREIPLLSLITDTVQVELSSIIISAVSCYLLFHSYFSHCPTCYLSHHLSRASHRFPCLSLSLRVSVCLHRLLTHPRHVPQRFYKLHQVQTVEDAGDADALNGREWAGEAGQILPPSLITWEREGWREVGGKKGKKERERYCMGRSERENEKEWAATQHSHQLPSIHHLPQPKGCHCFISISSLCTVCVCVCVRACIQKFMNICL